MPQVNVDFSDVHEFETLPVGEYLVEIVEAEIRESSTGKAMMTLQLEVQEPSQHQGRKVFDNLMLEGNALWRTKQVLDLILGDVPQGSYALDTDDLVGAQCMVQVAHRVWKVEDGGDGQARPDVRRYYDVSEGEFEEDIEDLFA